MDNQRQRKYQGSWGRKAEDLAVKLLTDKGYKILDRNFRSTFGEIDVVAIDNGTLVFVEVKARSSNKYGLPEESVNYFKLNKIKKTAEYYLFLHPELPEKMRIDVVAIELHEDLIISSKIIRLDS